jgi:hypothetical protein
MGLRTSLSRALGSIAFAPDNEAMRKQDSAKVNGRDRFMKSPQNRLPWDLVKGKIQALIAMTASPCLVLNR